MEVHDKQACAVDAGFAPERSAPCPCCSGRSYGECCAPCLEDGVWPVQPEALMRARYTAYATGRYAFLEESTLPEMRQPEQSAEKLAEAAEGVEWLRLDVLNAGAAERFGGRECQTVDYLVYYRYGESTIQHGEHAFFAKDDDGRLYYAGGEELRRTPIQREAPKVGRNDPCPCGSGKKYKKCCGKGQA